MCDRRQTSKFLSHDTFFLKRGFIVMFTADFFF